METIDLKHLRIVHTLVQYRSVIKTAEVLEVSPATVSYAINKIRGVVGSHLFIRTKKGMIPDSIARDLSARYMSMLKEETPSESEVTDQPRTQLTIRSNALIELMQSLSSNNKKNKCKTIYLPQSKSSEERIYSLKNKSVDIDIGTRLPEDSNIMKIKMFSSKVSLLASVNNRNMSDEHARSLWNIKENLLMSADTMDYFCNNIESSIQTKEYLEKGNASLTSANSLNLIAFCAYSDSVMLIPDFFVEKLKSFFPVVAYPLPDKLEIFYDCYLHCNSELFEEEGVIESFGHIFNGSDDATRYTFPASPKGEITS
ncbi:helix-turn-helix domain-containing protein [Dryocola clanedunensis]|uniref:helix-turn-helix domain-containing protein n=1 Tax=Cedecea sulfonylureivorans TaxID=3051154 RepID=UPI001927BE18|nr:LysR family transcriptional regulator [Cedecea sulfonylureivorans]